MYTAKNKIYFIHQHKNKQINLRCRNNLNIHLDIPDIHYKVGPIKNFI